MKKPIDYQFHTDGKKICVCTAIYDGVRFKGTAICNTELDTFDVEAGNALAKDRCYLAILKYKRRCAKLDNAFAKDWLRDIEATAKHNQKIIAASAERIAKAEADIAALTEKIATEYFGDK
jgi:hypothetical protein